MRKSELTPRQLKIKEIMQRMKNWGAKTTTHKICSDPERYDAEIVLVIYGTTYKAYGVGETRAEAKRVAMFAIASKAF